MTKRTRALTTFGRDLDSLLKQAGFSLREYADACGVNYKYLSQLRTISERRPGGLYVDLLKPFTRLKILDIAESHRLSSRHRGKHLSFTECHELFPELSDQEILESVKQASEVIDKVGTAYGEPEVGEQGSPENGQISARRELLYRNIFVGRQAELSALKDTFDAAVAGQGSLVMIAGEPGIGKTAICEQLSTYVVSRGGKTLWGHCYEEGSLSLPYLVFIEAMRSYVLDRETDDLKKELGSGASDVARIVLEIREKLNIEPREAQNPEEDRYRLFQAVSSFLTNAASVKPMIVILEDLHDADKGTLDMLSYASRNLAGTRLLLVGTYRDVEVDRSHPLSAALAELRRVSSFRRILLRGLNINEVRRLLARITQEEISVGLAEIVHRQTEGNPLFAQEVIRYLVEEKFLIQKEGRWRSAEDTTLEMSIPEGLRDVIGKRLTLLSNECNQLLSIAAVIGREFRLELLQKVAGIPDDELINDLEEARNAAMVEERSGLEATVTYRFTHALFRQTLYEETIAPRRIQLHQQVARALEEIYANRLAEHAAELSEHFSHTSQTADLEKAVSYGQMAAKRASDVYAYGEAVRLLEQALKVQEILDPDDEEEMCDLLLSLGEARRWAGEPTHVFEVEAPEALSLAEAIGDNTRVSRACSLALSVIAAAPGLGYTGRQAAYWIETAERYAEPGSLEHAWLDYYKGVRSNMRGSNNDGVPLLRQAREQAIAHGDKQLLMVTDVYLAVFGIAPWSAVEALQMAEEIESLVEDGVIIGTSILYSFSSFLTCGKRRQAEEVFRITKEIANRTGQAAQRITSMCTEANISFLDGNIEQAAEILEHMLEFTEDTDVGGVAFNEGIATGLRPILYLGITGQYRDRPLWKTIPEWMSRPVYRYVPLYPAYIGRTDEANEMLDRMLAARSNIATRDDLTNAWLDIAYLESAVLVGHHRAAGLLLERFKDNTLATTGHYWSTCIARHLGAAAALLERYDEARKHYQEAIRVCTEMKFRPDLALTYLQLAELLFDHYPEEKKEALEHLDFAIKEFREMKMQPALERALRWKDIL